MSDSLCNLNFGRFSPEYAKGAFHGRFVFYRPSNGKLFITTQLESDWCSFTHNQVASKATLYLKTEPALFDSWLMAMKSVAKMTTQEAILECV